MWRVSFQLYTKVGLEDKRLRVTNYFIENKRILIVVVNTDIMICVTSIVPMLVLLHVSPGRVPLHSVEFTSQPPTSGATQGTFGEVPIYIYIYIYREREIDR